MLKILLILKYLRRRRIAWVSLAAVTLCTTMVLVVISVMGGWLRMFRASFHGLNGDVIVSSSLLTGFPYYEEMIQKIGELPDVGQGHAVPVIQTYGLLNLYKQRIYGFQVLGFPIEQIGQVNDFPKSLYRQYQKPLQEELARLHEKELTPEQQAKFDAAHLPSFAKQNRDFYDGYIRRNANFDTIDGMIAGIGVIDIHKDPSGVMVGREGVKEFKYQEPIPLTLIRMDEESLSSPGANPRVVHNYVVVDDSHTGIYAEDSKTVYVPFDKLQSDLAMDQSKNGDQPARTSQIWIRIRPGADLSKACEKIQGICDEVVAAHPEKAIPVRVNTWEQQEGITTYLHAIENEKLLMTILFGIISIVAIFLIFCIFYMIVQEKTRDIGIIKSVGASNRSVAGIFLGYGLAIGVVGAGLGWLFGYLIIHNINFLHAQLAIWFHVKIWNPEVYAFDTIPSTMNPPEVAVIVSVAVVAAVAGAVVPALRAAWMTPVEALRWE